MTDRRAFLFGAVAGAMLLASCGARDGGEDTAGDPAASASATAAPAPAPSPSAAVGVARQEKEENELYSFEYSYPAQAAAIPGLKDLLDDRLARDRAELADEARKFKAEAEADGFPYRAYSRGTAWAVVADLPDWLSLSAESYVYSGGAHGMSFFDTLLWNRRTGKAQAPADLFTSAADLSGVVRAPFCAALDKERAKRREEPVVRSADDPFSECIDPMEQIVILGSSNGRTFDRIGFLIAPYNAGPYAEGAYEVTLPVTRAVIDAVRPAYRAGFSIRH